MSTEKTPFSAFGRTRKAESAIVDRPAPRQQHSNIYGLPGQETLDGALDPEQCLEMANQNKRSTETAVREIRREFDDSLIPSTPLYSPS